MKNVQALHTPQISYPCASMAYPWGARPSRREGDPFTEPHVARLTNAFLLDACLSTSQIGSHSFQHEKRSSFTYTSNKLPLCVDGLPLGSPAFPKGRRPIHRAARGPLDKRFPSRRLPINEPNWKPFVST